MGGMAGEAPYWPPRSGGAKARTHEPTVAQPHQLRRCWQCDRESHWRQMVVTLSTEFASDAARYRWGTAKEIPDLLARYQYGECVSQCRACLGEG